MATSLWSRDRLDSLADWLGIELDAAAHDRLETYGQWLVTEASIAGGIGPDEADRLFDRHMGDSLGYLLAVPSGAESLVDVGSGVGLPGIPLAIARSDLAVSLVDRSGRRCDLARRAVRVLGLTNVEVLQAEVGRLDRTWHVATFRASLPVDRAYEAIGDLIVHGGVGILGLSRLSEPPEPPAPPPGVVADVVSAEPPMLDSPLWLLRMRRTSPDHPPRES